MSFSAAWSNRAHLLSLCETLVLETGKSRPSSSQPQFYLLLSPCSVCVSLFVRLLMLQPADWWSESGSIFFDTNTGCAQPFCNFCPVSTSPLFTLFAAVFAIVGTLSRAWPWSIGGLLPLVLCCYWAPHSCQKATLWYKFEQPDFFLFAIIF